MSAAQDRLAALRREVGEVSVAAAAAEQAQGALLLDVREPEEVRAARPAGSLAISKGFLELRIEAAVPDKQRPVRVLCAGGSRSVFAAQALKELGYQNVRSVAGGFAAWKAAGLPLAAPELLSERARERYARHLIMPEVGEAGQRRLLTSKIAVIGAGGLGSPAAFYLAAAGVGSLRLIDADVVDRSNLQRQILHTEARIGMPKVDSARETLLALNPDIEIDARRERIRAANVEALLSDVDLVLDGTDNFPARYLINDACVKLGLPNVHGSIFRFEGQVTLFYAGRGAAGRPGELEREALIGPCYRCLYPEAPPAELAPNCAEAGVLGVLPGIVGSLQAVEALKWLLGIGSPLVGRLLHYDALTQQVRELEIAADPSCPACAPGRREHITYQDSDVACASRPAERP
jgi:sulfur-carrier protein adenylyltransferase/sulfurtransferase